MRGPGLVTKVGIFHRFYGVFGSDGWFEPILHIRQGAVNGDFLKVLPIHLHRMDYPGPIGLLNVGLAHVLWNGSFGDVGDRGGFGDKVERD